MRNLAVLIAFLLFAVVPVVGQSGDYPLLFEYDEDADDFYVVLDVDVIAGATLDVEIENGEGIYFYIYSDGGDLFEGESLDDFIAPFDGTLTIEIYSYSEAQGVLRVLAPDDAPVSPPATTAGGDFGAVECPFDVQRNLDVRCGTLSVPENRSDPNSATIQLMVAVIPSRSPSPAPDPIVYLEGGPGGSALAAVDTWFNSPLLDRRDLVLFDQRGTGFSEPSLNCPEMDEDTSVEAVEECRDRLLANGVDLTAYTSAENAADVEALRLALGYEQVNLLGISYGTRLALTVMRDYPDGVRSVILDSVYPPNIDTNYNVVSDTYELISRMFADCAADPACSAAYPDLEVRFYDQLEAISASPPEIENADGELVELYAEDVILQLIDQLKTTGLISAIPATLDAFASGDFDTYVDLFTNGAGDSLSSSSELAQELAQELTEDELNEIRALAADNDMAAIAQLLADIFELTDEEVGIAARGFIDLGVDVDTVEAVEPPDIDDDSEGMNLSVQCSEEMPFMSVEEADRRADAIDMPELLRDELKVGTLIEFEQCAVWPVGQLDVNENQPVVSDIPTLVLNARYDTATPPWWGELAAATLSNGFSFEFPMVGHGVIDGGPCPMSMVQAFVEDPLAAPDSSCISSMDADFWTP
ncbi:MAG: alpha/beta fold hydrolase [Chloroflexi bacterium]|nr:alpha/beta fold hydrolase [Chloroflexota bacterium]